MLSQSIQKYLVAQTILCACKKSPNVSEIHCQTKYSSQKDFPVFSNLRWTFFFNKMARAILLARKNIGYSLNIIANSSKRFYELATLHAFKNRQTLSKYIVKEDIHRQKLSCTFPIIGEPFASIAKSPLLKNPCRSRREWNSVWNKYKLKILNACSNKYNTNLFFL